MNILNIVKSLFNRQSASGAGLEAMTMAIAQRTYTNNTTYVGYRTKKNKPFKSKLIYIPDCDKLPMGARQSMYNANVLTRIAKHGLQTRLSSRGGKQILWRNLLKGYGNYKRMFVGP